MSGAGEDRCRIRSRSPCTLAPHAVATGDPVKAQRLPAGRCTTHTISLTSAPRVREARVKKQHQLPPFWGEEAEEARASS